MTTACDKHEVASAMEVIYEHTRGESFTIAGVVRDALEDPGGELFRVLAWMNKRNGRPTAYAFNRWMMDHAGATYDGWHTLRDKVTRWREDKGKVRAGATAWQIDRAYDPEMYAREESERMAAIDRQCD